MTAIEISIPRTPDSFQVSLRTKCENFSFSRNRMMRSEKSRNRFVRPRTSISQEPLLEPSTIIDFIQSIGETEANINSHTISQYTDRQLLRLSSRWSQAVEAARLTNHNDYDLSSVKFASTLSAECARLEVEAMSILVCKEASIEKKSPITTCYDDLDEEELQCEMEEIENSLSSLERELQEIDLIEQIHDEFFGEDSASDEGKKENDEQQTNMVLCKALHVDHGSYNTRMQSAFSFVQGYGRSVKC